MAPTASSVNESKSDSFNENVITALAPLTLLVFFLVYCCWGASCFQKLSSRISIFQQDNIEVPDSGSSDHVGLDHHMATPTIILLPYGRMLVVDGTVFARFHADRTGLDLFELGENILRRESNGRTASNSLTSSSNFLGSDSDFNPKEFVTPSNASPLPPTYESIFGDYQLIAPPSYTDAYGIFSEEINGDDHEDNNTRESTV